MTAKLANGLRFLPVSTPALPLLTSRWPRHMVLLVASEGEEEEMLIFDEGWLATGILIWYLYFFSPGIKFSLEFEVKGLL